MSANVVALTQAPCLKKQVEQLYKQHHSWLHTWLKGKLGCPDNAADLTQDTFVRIIQSRDALVSMREPRAYLVTTAKRLLIDKSRRELLEKNYLVELTAAAETCAGYPSVEQTWQAIEALEEISKILEQVSKKCQQAFLLYYLDGLSQKDIAKQLGTTTRTVRNYLVKILVHCQQYQASN
ncbi:MAG: sigma-70 family RNA polymerase sigma factor [Gammaproteobacteria bacterium]|nr:sigma-70 family RNA polymerase sigma factor [Gammaproteobacteria bacterium]